MFPDSIRAHLRVDRRFLQPRAKYCRTAAQSFKEKRMKSLFCMHLSFQTTKSELKRSVQRRSDRWAALTLVKDTRNRSRSGMCLRGMPKTRNCQGVADWMASRLRRNLKVNEAPSQRMPRRAPDSKNGGGNLGGNRERFQTRLPGRLLEQPRDPSGRVRRVTAVTD